MGLDSVMLLRQTEPDAEDLRQLYLVLLSTPQLLHSSAYVANSPPNHTDATGEILIPVPLVGCAIGAAIEIGADVLSGRKVNWLNAGAGCALGAIFGYPLGGKVALHSAHHFFPRFGRNLPHLQATLWEKGVKGSHRNWRLPLPWK
jgi:hypothetical protein